VGEDVQSPDDVEGLRGGHRHHHDAQRLRPQGRSGEQSPYCHARDSRSGPPWQQCQ
jgi:hypothetical protein